MANDHSSEFTTSGGSPGQIDPLGYETFAGGSSPPIPTPTVPATIPHDAVPPVAPPQKRFAAPRIGSLYKKAVSAEAHALQISLPLYHQCGVELAAVKASLKHGAWLPWLQQQEMVLGFGINTAGRLMRFGKSALTQNLTPARAIEISRELWGNEAPQSEPAAPSTPCDLSESEVGTAWANYRKTLPVEQEFGRVCYRFQEQVGARVLEERWKQLGVPITKGWQCVNAYHESQGFTRFRYEKRKHRDEPPDSMEELRKLAMEMLQLGYGQLLESGQADPSDLYSARCWAEGALWLKDRVFGPEGAAIVVTKALPEPDDNIGKLDFRGLAGGFMVLMATEELHAVYKMMAKRMHPDTGGDNQKMNRLNRLYQRLQKEYHDLQL